ncbi:MAG: hypothetical protein KDC27_09330 [Acidobacteria bacterium]|nr:hypothetical protein [Acidobacteriota bacterium]
MHKIALLLAVSALAAAQETPAPPAEYAKDAEATQPRPGPLGFSTLWMNPLEWTWVNSGREDTEIYFHHEGGAQARMMSKAEGKEPRQQLEETLERLRKLDPEARVTFEEERKVNGAPLLCVQIVVGEQQDKTVVYYGYLYGDEARTVQLFTIAAQADLPQLYVDLTSLLNGLEIAPQKRIVE